jgi:hypothetical protein
MNLPKQSFLALAAIGWVDGSLQRIEATGLLRAAKEAGLKGEDYAAIERATKNVLTLDEVDLGEMSARDQLLTFALGAWLSQVDGVVSPSERETLTKLGERLGVSEPLRIRATAAANDIACLPGGGRPERYDFEALVARLRERLPQVK